MDKQTIGIRKHTAKTKPKPRPTTAKAKVKKEVKEDGSHKK